MLAAPFRVVLDACVLYPMHLRDALLQAAHEGMYQVYWSNEILDEATRNLVANSHMEESKAARLVAMMSKSFPEAVVTEPHTQRPARMHQGASATTLRRARVGHHAANASSKGGSGYGWDEQPFRP